jgi:hypothetical protein
MKNIFYLLFVVVFSFSCQQEDLTKNKSYNLHQANMNPTRGEVIFTELAPGKLQVDILLKSSIEGVMHPAHLHFGSVREIGELAYVLNPVDGTTGKSTTIMDQVALSNGDIFTYDILGQMNGSVKIHMNDSYFRDRVLSFGNIGKNEDYIYSGAAIAVCN